MPWLETSPMDQRKQFIADFHRGLQSVTELADRFEISRKTAYKWIDRHEEEGANGLANRSRRPLSCPHETPQRIVDAVLEARRHHPRWGAKKLLRILRRKDPRETWPARTTVCDLLKRHDLIPKMRRRPRLGHPGRPLTPMTESNGIWTADFKGQFKTRDGVLCENSAEAGSLDEEPYSTQFQEACASELDPEPMAYDRDIRRVLRDASLSGTLAP